MGTAVDSFAYHHTVTMHTIFVQIDGTDRLVGIHRNSGATNLWDFEGAVQSNAPTFGSGPWEGSYVTFDVEEPNAPTLPSLTATSQTELQMRWTLSTDDGGTPITGHQVRIAAGTSIPANTQWVDTGSTDTEHTFTGLTPGTQYTAQVRTVNLVGPGAASASTSLSTMDRTMPEPEPEPEPEPMPPSASDVPMGLEVELTPTTALVKWKVPTNGASLQGYEISYEEGASPGTTWIPTESLSTRFFVKGLKRGTQYTWQVRGLTESGAGDASSPLTERTPIASLHNALFFKECVNYFDEGARVSVYGDPTNLVRAVGDNNYKTFTREKDLVLNIAVNGQPTRVDAIFVKGIDIEGHSAAPTGGSGSGYSNRRMPETVKNWEGTDVSTIVAGFQHDLYLLPAHFTAKEVRMTFTGADAKITEIALLEFGLEIDANGDFLDINQNFVDREGVVQLDPGGGLVYDSPIGADERDKWEVDYVVKIVPGKTLLETPEEFLYWQAENRNHFFFMEPSRFPWRGFPAVFVRKSVPVRYITDDKLGRRSAEFSGGGAVGLNRRFSRILTDGRGLWDFGLSAVFVRKTGLGHYSSKTQTGKFALQKSREAEFTPTK